MTPIGFEIHDHSDCIDSALAAAEAHCADEGLQLTPIRHRVLAILLAHHRALGAYEILDVLRADGMNAQPPVAYRALDFLVKYGFAHRVERLNAFVACTAPGQSHAPVLLICRNCQAVAETQADSAAALGQAASGANFAVERAVMEAEGLCPTCQGILA
ncbi:Fur family transcriptional regulator, zinc uptake regulator [Jannaschia faecimaris]|uniref:Fur family transcriptional regulator, zinc uptake regulator n=1 Tax=Jannaschia faecimaris TaxID=1244108 RepID=A0A1H3U2Y3_9RHOB|nr:transcriptional repressor [Jannaschia faecimaris]SDZ56657.1 Fur family transcriptional regulator, zinc uptake regulator [Jannaschia faecimaris]